MHDGDLQFFGLTGGTQFSTIYSIQYGCLGRQFSTWVAALPLPTPPSSDPNTNVILVANTAAIIAATAKLPLLVRALLLI